MPMKMAMSPKPALRYPSSCVAAGAPVTLAPGGSVSLNARSLMLFQHAAQGARP